MNYFYIKHSEENKYKLGFTSQPIYDSKIILQIICKLDLHLLQKEFQWTEENPEIIHTDLKQLLLFCITHLQLPEIKKEVPVVVNPDENSSSNENLTINLLPEENHQEFHQILQKVDSFKNNILKFQKNLESIKNLKLPVKNTQTKLVIPKVFHSERPSRGGSENDFITKEDCKKWIQNKTINPKTGRKIDIGGPTYKKFEIMSRTYGVFS
jgi:hypothetical protein